MVFVAHRRMKRADAARIGARDILTLTLPKLCTAVVPGIVIRTARNARAEVLACSNRSVPKVRHLTTRYPIAMTLITGDAVPMRMRYLPDKTAAKQDQGEQVTHRMSPDSDRAQVARFTIFLTRL